MGVGIRFLFPQFNINVFRLDFLPAGHPGDTSAVTDVAWPPRPESSGRCADLVGGRTGSEGMAEFTNDARALHPEGRSQSSLTRGSAYHAVLR